MTDHGLSGRVALVTGASGGIGAAISRVLAEAGATVALGYGRNGERAEQLASELDGSAAFGAELALAVLTNGFITSKVFPIDGGMYPR